MGAKEVKPAPDRSPGEGVADATRARATSFQSKTVSAKPASGTIDRARATSQGVSPAFDMLASESAARLRIGPEDTSMIVPRPRSVQCRK